MKFIDEIILEACSGNGGDGVVRFSTARGKPKGGPSGGNGGNGGSVVVRAIRDVALLSKYRGNNKFKAEDGTPGGTGSLYGKNGSDVIINLPVGSVVTVGSTGSQFELTKEGEEVKVLRGGTGGYGNEHFKSSRNVTPQEHTDGKLGSCTALYIELKLIADAGLIGFPNAGKSSLLNSLTRAHAKVGDYQFTTLDPNLGEVYGHILADIPGLIEGASEGKGLGDKFLRHIMRTNTLIHCISVEREDIESAYSAVRAELKAYNPELLDKQEIIVLTKVDLISQDKLDDFLLKAALLSDDVVAVSILDDESIKFLQDKLTKIL